MSPAMAGTTTGTRNTGLVRPAAACRARRARHRAHIAAAHIIRRLMSVTKKIAVVPGDGIGPEVIEQGMRVLERVNAARGLGLEFVHFGWNADEYLRTG